MECGKIEWKKGKMSVLFYCNLLTRSAWNSVSEVLEVQYFPGKHALGPLLKKRTCGAICYRQILS